MCKIFYYYIKKTAFFAGSSRQPADQTRKPADSPGLNRLTPLFHLWPVVLSQDLLISFFDTWMCGQQCAMMVDGAQALSS